MQREFDPCVYIMASRRNGTLYTGVTSNLVQRIHEHREAATPGFTSKYGVKRLFGGELRLSAARADWVPAFAGMTKKG